MGEVSQFTIARSLRLSAVDLDRSTPFGRQRTANRWKDWCRWVSEWGQFNIGRKDI